MRLIRNSALTLLFAGCLAGSASALTIDSADRTFTLNVATASGSGVGNHSVGAINGYFGGTWAKEFEIAANSGSGVFTDDLFSINITSGAFGGTSVSGTWSLGASYWSLFGNAVIAFHVGNGQGDPDHAAFKLEVGATSGTWSYLDKDGKGGGLSNLFVYSNGTPPPPPPPGPGVPDSGATVAMLGLSLVVATLTRRFFRS